MPCSAGTKELVFNYTVGALGSGQDTADLATASSNALILNGGTISVCVDNTATLSIYTLSLHDALPIFDTTAPTVSSITAPTADDGAGTVVAFTVNFSEAVTVNT